MGLIVLKFGGTSLATTKLMKNAAKIVAEHVNQGKRVVVVVSAMAGVTNHLVHLVNEITSCETKASLAEYANVITTGEQVSAGLFTLLIQEIGIKARSWLNWQMKIITDDNFADANIIEINAVQILESFNQGYKVAVVAGFQGVTELNRASTLGRGGSDTTAIILAGALDAERCDIYTDVEGVFTVDPRIVAKAQKISEINYDEMIAFANAGAKVLQEKSVRWAQHYNLEVQVLSSFTENPGTMIRRVNKASPVVGIALSNDINEFLELNKFKLPKNMDIVKVSVIGSGIESNLKIITIFKNALEKANIEVLFTHTSAMTLSFLITEEYKFDAVKLLHNVWNLE
ncbi:MAG: aspartate kinase [Rickettsiales bacterium]